MAIAAAGRDPYGKLWTYNGVTFYVGLFGLLLFIPLIVLPLSLVTGLTVFAFEILVGVWFAMRAPKTPWRSPYRAPDD
jgi:hypothetical protein